MHASSTVLEADEPVVRQDDHATFVFILCEGLASVLVTHDIDDVRTTRMVGQARPGDILGIEPVVHVTMKHTVSIVCITPCRLMKIAVEDVEDALVSHQEANTQLVELAKENVAQWTATWERDKWHSSEEVIEYEVVVGTGASWGAGTRSIIWIELLGDDCNSRKVRLNDKLVAGLSGDMEVDADMPGKPKQQKLPFQRTGVDTFKMKCMDVGELRRIVIGFIPPDEDVDGSWLCDWVVVDIPGHVRRQPLAHTRASTEYY